MKSFGAFVVSLCMGGFAAAAPTQNPGETFTVKAAHNPDHVPVGPLALAKAYNKYNVPMPDDLIKAVERITGEVLAGRATGEVPANPAPQGYDLEYIAEVDIGTPAQKLYFDFDTGSSDLWTFSENTPSAQVNGHPKYKPSQSSTSKKLSGYSWSISYADESSSKGDVYTDKVTIGGLTVKTQAVETATQVSSQFSKNPSSQFTGLLGLGFDKINTVQPRKQKTWFSNIKNSLDKALFTANLNHQSDGNYNFGFIDDSEHKGSIIYTPVDSSRGYWGFTSTGYAIGNDNFVNTDIDSIADTGTSLILLPNSTVQDYWSNVRSSYYNSNIAAIAFDCRESLPDFTFGVGDSSITVPGSLINYGYADDQGKDCFGGIQAIRGLSLFGDVAMKAALVVFDDENQRVGWAQK